VQEQKLESTGKANAQARDALLAAATLLKELSALLGLFRQAPAARGAADDQFASGLMALVLELRADARAAKNWSVSDKIRDRLKALRVVVEDRPEGVTWRKE
jgi:cysteinyl-tRNA synthetase